MVNNNAVGWTGVWLDSLVLSMDAATVIGLRLAKIALGGRAGSDEARLMVSEKISAGLELQAKLGSNMRFSPLRRSQDVLGHYGRVVRANRERLSN